MSKIYNKICFFIFLIIIFLFSCNIYSKKNNLSNNSVIIESEVNIRSTLEYKYYDVLNISPAKIIIPKNQTVAQSLSVIVNDGHGNLVVFDGGRVEDADYLCDIIKDNGGVVTTWFITHIHDDHIGALYKILSDKRTDIEIQEIYYDFASFDWYYEKMGNDAGIYNIFLNSIEEYNNYLNGINKNIISINNIIQGNIGYYYYPENKWFDPETKKYMDIPNSHMNVYILNNHYELEQDPINNTSVAYIVDLFGDSGKNSHCQILILGDLGFEGGNKLFKENFVFDYIQEMPHETYKYDYFKYIGPGWPDYSYYYKKQIENLDVILLSHHGQNGIDPELYKKFSPKVVVWPTSKDIYENTRGKYYTDDTKKALSEMSSIEYEIKSYEETAVIR